MSEAHTRGEPALEPSRLRACNGTDCHLNDRVARRELRRIGCTNHPHPST